MPIPKETLGLREASERFGVSVDTLRRRIKDDAMPEAFKAEGKFGTTWVLPLSAMADIADRERWVLDLDIGGAPEDLPTTGLQAASHHEADPAITNRALDKTSMQSSTAGGSAHTLTKVLPTGLPTPLPTHDTPMPHGMLVAPAIQAQPPSRPLIREENLEWVERLLAAETRATSAETRLETMEADAVAIERRIGQLTSDLEQERAELRRLRTDLASEEKAKAVAIARTDELRGQLKQDRIDLEARIGDATTEAQSQQARAEELHLKLGDAHAAMGWWSKRRLNKLETNNNK